MTTTNINRVTMRLLVAVVHVLVVVAIVSSFSSITTITAVTALQQFQQPSSPTMMMASNPTSKYLTKLHYTTRTADVPESAQTVAFEENVRNLMANNKHHKQEQEQATSAAASTTTTPTTPAPITSTTSTWSHIPNMKDITSIQEFQSHVVEQTQQSRQITVVRFHAPFCRACRAMSPLLERFAISNPHINFIQISYNKQNPETKELIKMLGITKVPHGQIYVPDIGLVEEFNMNKKYFSTVQETIQSYDRGNCVLPNDVNEYSKLYESPYGMKSSSSSSSNTAAAATTTATRTTYYQSPSSQL